MRVDASPDFLQRLCLVLNLFDREAACALVNEAASRAHNQNYFRDPSRYGPWTLVGDELPDDLLMVDLSPPSMSSLVYVASALSKDPTTRILDFGCGLSAFSYYSAHLISGTVATYDDYSQVKEEVVSQFYGRLGRPQPMSRAEVLAFEPTVLSAHGIWIDPDLYAIESVSTVLSDRLYNSGAVAGEGPFHYDSDWAQQPERFGFHKVHQLPFLDVYERH